LADAPLEIASKTGFVLVDDILPKEEHLKRMLRLCLQ
jgi:hypothetical protein